MRRLLKNKKFKPLQQFLLSFALLWVCQYSLADTHDNSSRLMEYLLQEKNSITLAIHTIKSLPLPQEEAQLKTKLQDNKLALNVNDLKIESLNAFLNNLQKKQAEIIQKTKYMQQDEMEKTGLLASQESKARIDAWNVINKKTIELLEEDLDLAKEYRVVLNQESEELQKAQAGLRWKDQLHRIHQKEHDINEVLSQFVQKNIDLQQQGRQEKSSQQRMQQESEVLLNNQYIMLAQQQLTELKVQKKVLKADYLLFKTKNIKNLEAATDTYLQAIDQFSLIENVYKKMLTFLEKEQHWLENNSIKQRCQSLQQEIKKKLQETALQQQTLQEDLEGYQQQLQKQISARQTLADYRLDGLPTILKQLGSIPQELYTYVKTLVIKIRSNYIWKDALPVGFLWGSLVFILVIALALSRALHTLTHNKERSRLTGHLYGGMLTIINRNIPHITLLSMLLVTLFITQIPFSQYELLVNLSIVWLTFRTLILIARLSLLERISDSSGKDVKLYHRLKWLILAGGWVTALMLLSHQLPLPLIIQDIFNRLFMLFILAISLVAWRSRDVLPHLAEPYLQNKKRYYRNAVHLLAILVPFTLFTTAILGLTGFINLAWTMSSYQASILLVITGYVLMRGLLFDALEILSEWMIFSLRNGWLWIEVLLKPLDKALRVGLLLLAFGVLFQIFGWFNNEKVMLGLHGLAMLPIINISGVHITVLSSVEFFVLVSFFIWASKWTREFCYRWLFRNARDAGIRNSLAAFSQYAIILIGSIITLRVLGLDFSGMSMILGGLAVGMGFGLRDFASNIIGGILLLIERPVRKGDIINIGGYEGEVSHIGIRSMRVSTWDNMEVLIPNAETFNKPFTNWTHQDNVIRTVLPVKVSREDDPVFVQQLILDVLATSPEILSDPPAQVFLKNIDEALIEFEIRYFINVVLHTRFEVRSKVLFAITAQFKAAGVKAPIPPYKINVIEDENEPILLRKAPQG